MAAGRKKLHVVGDRVLIQPESGESRTNVGLILPESAIDKLTVQSGRIVEIGPGIPIPSPADADEEPWKRHESGPRYFPMQARIGDVALFLRSGAVEIEFEEKKYLIVPQNAILLLVRDAQEDLPLDDLDELE